MASSTLVLPLPLAPTRKLKPGDKARSAVSMLRKSRINKLYKLTKNIQWPKTKLRIERGEMPETLLEIMQKEQCDLLVCGHHHSFINRLMPAYRGMINKMSADLLIVPFIDK